MRPSNRRDRLRLHALRTLISSFGWLLCTLFFSSFSTSVVVAQQQQQQQQETAAPEALFRQAVAAWQDPQTQRSNDWSSWHQLSRQLWTRFEASQPSSGNKDVKDDKDNVDKTLSNQDDATTTTTRHRLELIGAMEESILAIERTVFGTQQQSQTQAHTNRVRDQALAVLYLTYAKALYHLSAHECWQLALDPHTLLMGADTVDSTSEPSLILCVQNAENSLRNAATLDAANPDVATWLDQVLDGQAAVHQRKPKEFVAELFDSFADTFDDKLLQGLEYRVPSLVGQLAHKVTGAAPYRAVLDAGCGTGLAGRQLRPLMEKQALLVGVDASQKMLDKAALCTTTRGCGGEAKTDDKDKKDDGSNNNNSNEAPLYDHLLQMDLEEMTLDTVIPSHFHSQVQGFDLIVAADVLVYFGQLDPLLQTLAQLSLAGARLIFSCELAEESEAPLGWRLLPSGRFAHTREHAVTSAQQAGYQLRHYQEIVPRMEKGEPVRGHLFAFEYDGNDSTKPGDEL